MPSRQLKAQVKHDQSTRSPVWCLLPSLVPSTMSSTMKCKYQVSIRLSRSMATYAILYIPYSRGLQVLGSYTVNMTGDSELHSVVWFLGIPTFNFNGSVSLARSCFRISAMVFGPFLSDLEKP